MSKQVQQRLRLHQCHLSTGATFPVQPSTGGCHSTVRCSAAARWRSPGRRSAAPGVLQRGDVQRRPSDSRRTPIPRMAGTLTRPTTPQQQQASSEDAHRRANPPVNKLHRAARRRCCRLVAARTDNSVRTHARKRPVAPLVNNMSPTTDPARTYKRACSEWAEESGGVLTSLRCHRRRTERSLEREHDDCRDQHQTARRQRFVAHMGAGAAFVILGAWTSFAPATSSNSMTVAMYRCICRPGSRPR